MKRLASSEAGLALLIAGSLRGFNMHILVVIAVIIWALVALGNFFWIIVMAWDIFNDKITRP